MVLGCMSGKGTGKMVVLSSSVNGYIYGGILDTFVVPSGERIFKDDDIIFQDDNTTCCRAKTVKTFFPIKRHKVNAMARK